MQPWRSDTACSALPEVFILLKYNSLNERKAIATWLLGPLEVTTAQK